MFLATEMIDSSLTLFNLPLPIGVFSLRREVDHSDFLPGLVFSIRKRTLLHNEDSSVFY